MMTTTPHNTGTVIHPTHIFTIKPKWAHLNLTFTVWDQGRRYDKEMAKVNTICYFNHAAHAEFIVCTLYRMEQQRPWSACRLAQPEPGTCCSR